MRGVVQESTRGCVSSVSWLVCRDWPVTPQPCTTWLFSDTARMSWLGSAVLRRDTSSVLRCAALRTVASPEESFPGDSQEGMGVSSTV